jgi:hypothetical protein
MLCVLNSSSLHLIRIYQLLLMAPFQMFQSCRAHISVHPCLPVWMYMVLEVTELFLTSWVMNLLHVMVTKAVNYQTLTLLVLAGH